MNSPLKKFLLLAVVSAAATAVPAETPKTAPTTPAKPAAPRSVFIMPASAREGRDPFFPESSRPYEEAVASKHTIESNAFTIKGMSFERGRAMVIINNHTFAVGDEGDVLTVNGRVHIRLADIHNNTAVIEVNGARRELSIGAK